MLATYFIARSKLGYAFVAIRENEDAAQVLGVWPTRYKVTACALGATMTAAAGAVYARANGFIDPSIAFAIDNNVFPIVMAILGGMGTASGPFIGAVLLAGDQRDLAVRVPQDPLAVLRGDHRAGRAVLAARHHVPDRLTRRLRRYLADRAAFRV